MPLGIPTIDEVPPSEYDAERFNGDLYRIAAAYPTNRNPFDPGTAVCLYRSGEGMCIIGAWLEMRGHGYDAGWDEAAEGASSILHDLGYPGLVGFCARDWQVAADNKGRPLAWGEVA